MADFEISFRIKVKDQMTQEWHYFSKEAVETIFSADLDDPMELTIEDLQIKPITTQQVGEGGLEPDVPYEEIEESLDEEEWEEAYPS